MMRVRLAVLLCLLVAFPTAAAPVGESTVDSRLVIDFVAPDQQASAKNCMVDWGHYTQHRTNHGTLRPTGGTAEGVWTSAVLNVNNPAVDWTYLTWTGKGDVTFELRGGRDDGGRRGRVDPGSWTSWRKPAGSGTKRGIPDALDGCPYLQLRVTLPGGARVTRIEIHKNITLPDHPRIFVTKKLLDRARKRVADDPEIGRIRDRYIDAMKGRLRWGNMRRNTNPWIVNGWATSVAVAWHLSGHRPFLDEAKAQIARAESEWARKLGHFDRPVFLEGVSAAYDIVYNDLSAQERTRLARGILDVADTQRKAWVFSDLSNQAYTNAATPMFIGIALAGESADPRAEKYWRFAEDRIRLHILPGTNGWAKDDGGFGEGHDYFGFTSGPLMRELMAWASATGEDVFEIAGIIRHASHWKAYARRPWSGTLAKFCDSGRGSLSLPAPAYIAARYRDRHAQAHAADLLKKNSSDFAAVHWWRHVLWYDPGLPLAAGFDYKGTDLPLGRHFEGVGHVVCRSGWDKGDTWAVFKSGPYYTGGGAHTHADENSFVIDRKGSLAIDSGTDSSPRRSHYRNYFTRTIAHNSITLFDPEEKFPKADSNDGGQFGGTFSKLRGGRFDSAQWGAHIGGRELSLNGIVAFQTGAHHTYACGDATRAYSRHKVSEFMREFVFVQPGSFVIFDRVTSKNTRFRKTWLLHGTSRPAIQGKKFTFTDDQGKLVAETLLPAGAKINRVGGPGKEFWVNGKNYPIDGKSKSGGWDAGAWRVEVTPGGAAERDLFLHVLHALDADAEAPAPARLTQDDASVTVSFRAYGRDVRVTFGKAAGAEGRLLVRKDGATLTDVKLERRIQPQRFDSTDIWE